MNPPEHKKPSLPTLQECGDAGAAQHEVATRVCAEVEALASKIYGVPCDANFVIMPSYRVYFGLGGKMKFSDFTAKQITAFVGELKKAEQDEVLAEQFRRAFNGG